MGLVSSHTGDVLFLAHGLAASVLQVLSVHYFGVLELLKGHCGHEGGSSVRATVGRHGVVLLLLALSRHSCF